jgi:V/A-type H+-transporting ATPase subunit E
VNGLDRIIKEIASDAEYNSRKTVSQAKQQAEQILRRAEEKLVQIKGKATADAELEYKKYIAMAKSTADVDIKRCVLRKKQELITKIIDDAQAKLLKLSDADYFECMEKLLKNSATEGCGEIFFSAKDKARVTEKFKSAADKLGIKISEDVRDIDGGFILVYGDIEENCSVSALFEQKYDRLSDEVNSFLFAV